jgi:hypothetical protein
MFVSNMCSAIKPRNSATSRSVFSREQLKHHIIRLGSAILTDKVVAFMRPTEVRHLHPLPTANDGLRADAELLRSLPSLSAASNCEGGK